MTSEQRHIESDKVPKSSQTVHVAECVPLLQSVWRGPVHPPGDPQEGHPPGGGVVHQDCGGEGGEGHVQPGGCVQVVWASVPH